MNTNKNFSVEYVSDEHSDVFFFMHHGVEIRVNVYLNGKKFLSNMPLDTAFAGIDYSSFCVEDYLEDDAAIHEYLEDCGLDAEDFRTLEETNTHKNGCYLGNDYYLGNGYSEKWSCNKLHRAYFNDEFEKSYCDDYTDVCLEDFMDELNNFENIVELINFIRDNKLCDDMDFYIDDDFETDEWYDALLAA